jgi:hypothetical protein
MQTARRTRQALHPDVEPGDLFALRPPGTMARHFAAGSQAMKLHRSVWLMYCDLMVGEAGGR